MDQIGPNGHNRTVQDRGGLNGLKWTEYDRGPNKYEWTDQDQSGHNGPNETKVDIMD